MRPEALEFLVPGEPVNVEMVQRAAAGVFVAKDERGADDLASVDAASGGEGLDKAGFSGAERAAEGHDSAVG